MAIQSDKATEYCLKYPNMKTRPLAELIFKENPKLFPNYEAARSCIRTRRGRNGEQHRACCRTTLVPYVPEPDNTPWSPVVVPNTIKSMLLLYDPHIPYHDKEAIEIAVSSGKKRKVTGVVWPGDFMDCYQISRFVKDPSKRDFSDEAETMKELDREVTRFLGKPYTIMMEGNHEARVPTYVRSVAPALAKLKGVQLPNILECEERGIKWVDRCRPVIFGHLNILHGHEFGGWMSAPVNPARTLYMRCKAISVMGHLHRDSSHSESSPISKQMISTWSVGCLCGLRPEYRPLNNWSHGFAIVTRTDSDKGFRLENFKIIKGKVFPA